MIKSLRKQKQKDHRPKASLGYIVSLRPAWANCETLSQKARQKKKRKSEKEKEKG